MEPTCTFRELFPHRNKIIVGMVHLWPLRGAPRYSGDFDGVVRRALDDARSLVEGGVDALMVENLGDTPYFRDQVPATTVADMTRILTHLRKRVNIPFGVNVLRNDAQSALAIAAAVDASFIRANILTGAMVTDQGIIEARAAELMRLRKTLGATRIHVLADVMVKHASPLAAHYSIERDAEELAMRAMADAVIVSGPGTGLATSFQDIMMTRTAVGQEFPVLIGSGLNTRNLAQSLDHADGAIVGSFFKEGGRLDGPVIVEKVRDLMDRVKLL